ncbi:hypothetical protein BAE44_0016701 [Dichanthelium oligosanthes]|uniref:SCP domain-containing protein n=1 Tax=Dichanthelium oligosanthes TaxID=888268 RepID=A0A1E5VAW4_9POAL|nr:hypothetical protein BAE44_0016701 [Dichanthelium oligosanthes]
MRGICISKLAFLLLCAWILLGPAASAAKIHGNPANDLVALINGKREASKLPALRNSAGLGCMALQYISECMATGAAACSSDNTVACQPPEAHITEVYAADCGVELPTVDVISGRLVGCHRERAGPEDGLQAVLASAAGNTSSNSKANATEAAALAVMRGKEHTQVGAGFDRAHRHGPFFWCLLFSSGSANSTFLLEAGGKGIQQTHGCFSAPDRTSCSAAPPGPRLVGAAAALLLFLFHFQFLLVSY